MECRDSKRGAFPSAFGPRLFPIPAALDLVLIAGEAACECAGSGLMNACTNVGLFQTTSTLLSTSAKSLACGITPNVWWSALQPTTSTPSRFCSCSSLGSFTSSMQDGGASSSVWMWRRNGGRKWGRRRGMCSGTRWRCSREGRLGCGGSRTCSLDEHFFRRLWLSTGASADGSSFREVFWRSAR